MSPLDSKEDTSIEFLSINDSDETEPQFQHQLRRGLTKNVTCYWWHTASLTGKLTYKEPYIKESDM